MALRPPGQGLERLHSAMSGDGRCLRLLCTAFRDRSACSSPVPVTCPLRHLHAVASAAPEHAVPFLEAVAGVPPLAGDMRPLSLLGSLSPGSASPASTVAQLPHLAAMQAAGAGDGLVFLAAVPTRQRKEERGGGGDGDSGPIPLLRRLSSTREELPFLAAIAAVPAAAGPAQTAAAAVPAQAPTEPRSAAPSSPHPPSGSAADAARSPHRAALRSPPLRHLNAMRGLAGELPFLAAMACPSRPPPCPAARVAQLAAAAGPSCVRVRLLAAAQASPGSPKAVVSSLPEGSAPPPLPGTATSAAAAAVLVLCAAAHSAGRVRKPRKPAQQAAAAARGDQQRRQPQPRRQVPSPSPPHGAKRRPKQPSPRANADRPAAESDGLSGLQTLMRLERDLDAVAALVRADDGQPAQGPKAPSAPRSAGRGQQRPAAEPTGPPGPAAPTSLPPVRLGSWRPHPPGYVPEFKPAPQLHRPVVEPGVDGHAAFEHLLRLRRQQERQRRREQVDRIEDMRQRAERDRQLREEQQMVRAREAKKREQELEAQRIHAREEQEKERELRRVRLNIPPRPPHVPLHKVLEQRYQEEVVMPALEQQREELRKRRAAFERKPVEELLEHDRRYMEIVKVRNEAKTQEIRGEIRAHAQHMHKYDDTRAARVPDPRTQHRDEAERRMQQHRERLQRVKQYGQHIKEAHAPHAPTPSKPVSPAASTPQRGRCLGAEDHKRVGNDYMHQAAQKARRRSKSTPAPAVETDKDEEQAREMRDRGNRYMAQARNHIRRVQPETPAAAGSPASAPPDQSKSPARGGALQPLRAKVRRLDRVFANQQLLAGDASDVREQQDRAMAAVEAVRAKIELLRQVSDS
eukprot:TRINITY_DN26133_c0_g1_i2.p1 TRINITY_DN26133_c0_g1~~TRINITY_DN26133_c0_g1_i2.p1  ORF type:complete len:858 (+),score=313.62 TRINITY_DN26133_c0_g1_i2:82-2655(+)